GVGARIRFLQGDLFSPLAPVLGGEGLGVREPNPGTAPSPPAPLPPSTGGEGRPEQFNFIVSNPPYIADEAMATLPVGVRQYEPHQALQGGPGGFVVFDRLIAD